MELIIAGVISGIIYGIATNAVISNKGYEENWFWWGFFFGLIALIVAISKPQNLDYLINDSKQKNTACPANTVNDERFLSAGGWKCKCGKVHPPYVSSCSCGTSKNGRSSPAKSQGQTDPAENTDELSRINTIKEYKALLDSGAISQEEFEAKKKQLLGL